MRKRKPAIAFSWEDEEEVEDDDDDEEESDSEGKVVSDGDNDDPNETADAKRIRLARTYLSKLKDDGRRRHGAASSSEGESDEGGSDDEGGDFIGQALRKEVQDARGELFRPLAELAREARVGVTVHRGHQLSATCVAMCEDESMAFTGSKDGTLICWDVNTGKKVVQFGRRRGTAFSADGSELGHAGDVLGVAVDTDGKFLASGGRDRTVRVWDLRSNTLVQTFKLFSASHDRTVKIWNLDQMAYVETLFGHQSELNCIDSLRKDRAMTAGTDRTVRVWKVLEETQLVFQKGHEASVDALTMVDEQRFVTGGADGALCLWSNAKKRPLHCVPGAHSATVGLEDDAWGAEPRWITALSSVRSSDLVASGSCNGQMRLWRCDVEAAQLEACRNIPMNGFINGIAFGKAGRVIAAAVGQEPRLGRWGIQKKARNGLHLVVLGSASE